MCAYILIIDTLDADLGVAVVFDSDPEDDSDFEVKEGDSDDDMDEQDGELEGANGETLQSTEGMEDAATSTAQLDLDPREIDAFWLQRKISLDHCHSNTRKNLITLRYPRLRTIQMRRKH
jgi:hypothetical protein